MSLTVGSFFSGIGGLDLGLERAGMRVIWQSEIDPYATRVLAKHWPEVPNLGDITRINWRDVVRPDVICGGYPCQPFSTAGARRGEHDPRHLWPYVRTAISELRPKYAILENVRGHLSLGGLSVIGDLTALGYCAEWRIVSAASVGANHRRDRIIIVAYPDGENESDVTVNGQRQEVVGMVADTDDDGQPPPQKPRSTRKRSNSNKTGTIAAIESTRRSSQLSPLADASEQRLQERQSAPSHEVFAGDARRRCGGFGSIPDWWASEPGMGRVANGVPKRLDRLKGLGNAVVPQVAEVIGRLVVAHNEQQPR